MHPLFHAKSLVKYFIHLVSFGNISICILDIYAPFLEILDPPLIGTITMRDIRKVRSGMGAYIGAARRRVHIAMVLLRPPSGHRPGRRQARRAHILRIGLHLTQPRNMRAATRHGPWHVPYGCSIGCFSEFSEFSYVLRVDLAFSR